MSVRTVEEFKADGQSEGSFDYRHDSGADRGRGKRDTQHPLNETEEWGDAARRP